jgi:hypothetical protein
MTKLRTAVLAGLVALTGACGGSSNSKTGTGGTGGGSSDSGAGGGDAAAAINVAVSGTASPHPLSAALDPTADFSMLAVSVVDPSLELQGLPPLATGPIDPANCIGPSDGGTGDAASDGGAAGPTGPVCTWSFPTVDIHTISLGLVGIVADQRTTNPIWVRTGTGAGTAAFIDMEKTSKAPITNRQLFAISTGTQDKLAQLVSAILTQTDGGAPLSGSALQARGYMIGNVVGKLSEGAPPVAGATVSVPTTAAVFDIFYPNDTFSGAQTSTNTSGIFLAVPKAAATAGPHITQWTVTPPSNSTLTWQAYTSGTQPGAAFVLIFLADESGGG